MEEDKRIFKLKNFNPHISCSLCGGYLVDATTIVECIHTFCRSCLVSYIGRDNKKCPECGTVIHHSYPLQYIAFDRTLQDIVEKLVPHLKRNNLSNDSTRKEEVLDVDDGKTTNYHRLDDQVDLCLRNANTSMKSLKRPFIQCSVNATIKILKKYLAKQLGLGLQRYSDLDILCNDEILGKDHTLRFILVTRWRTKKPPLHLEYRPRIALL